MRSPISVWRRISFHSISSRRRASWRMSSGIAILPMSWSCAARAIWSSCLGVQPGAPTELDRRLGHLVGVFLHRRVALVEDAQQQVVGLLHRRVDRLLFSSYMRWSAIRRASAGVVASPGSISQPPEAPIENPSPFSESASRAFSTVVHHGSVAVAGLAEHAELVAAQPVCGSGTGNRARQGRAEPLQQGVTGGMAEVVVVGLEAVEIEQREQVVAGSWRWERTLEVLRAACGGCPGR